MVISDRFQEYFVKAWKIVRLNEETIDEISKDKNVLPYAILIAVLPSLLQFALISLAFRRFIWQDFVVQLVVMALSLLLIPVLAVLGRNIGKYKNVFATSVTYLSFIRPALIVGVISWLVLIPFVLLVMGLPVEPFLNFFALGTAVWTLFIYFRLLKFLYRLTAFKSFLVLIISLLILTSVSGFILEMLMKLGLQSEVLSKLLGTATS